MFPVGKIVTYQKTTGNSRLYKMTHDKPVSFNSGTKIETLLHHYSTNC